jgi:hypothetical protein
VQLAAMRPRFGVAEMAGEPTAELADSSSFGEASATLATVG